MNEPVNATDCKTTGQEYKRLSRLPPSLASLSSITNPLAFRFLLTEIGGGPYGGERCVMPVISVLSPSSLQGTGYPCGTHANLSLGPVPDICVPEQTNKEQHVF